jgi:hypothetical protein
MAAPFSTLRSKLNRAVCAYLISQGVGSTEDTVPAYSQGTYAFPNTTVRATLGTPDPPFSGNYRITLHVSIKGSAVQSAQDPNGDLAHIEFDERVAAVQDALMMGNGCDSLADTAAAINAAGRALAVAQDPSDPASVQQAANNADMVDFTLIQWIDRGFGDGMADAKDCTWEEILIFEAYCCSRNVD